MNGLLHLLRRLTIAMVAVSACARFANAAPASSLLPDLERGIAALEAGDLDRAERDLRPLAQRGYAEAQLRLARLYLRRGTPEALDQAVHWFRMALEDGQPVHVDLARALMSAGIADSEVDRLLQAAMVDDDTEALHLRLRLYRLHPELDVNSDGEWLAERAASSKRLKDASEALGWYRLRADQAEPAQRVVELCTQWLPSLPDCYKDLARHHRAANDRAALAALVNGAAARYETERLPADAIEAIAHTLMSSELAGHRNPPTAYRLLSMVEARSQTATTRMARLLLEDPSLDPDRSARELLDRAYARGDPEAALYLGRLHLDPQSPEADPLQAEALLSEASASSPAAHFYLGRLYDRGYLGHTEPERALNHYLLAARSGHAHADLELARLFWINRGVKVDPVNAYCFARLAEQSGVPGARALLDELTRVLDAAQIDRGRRKADAELLARHQAPAAADTAPTTLTRAEELAQ